MSGFVEYDEDRDAHVLEPDKVDRISIPVDFDLENGGMSYERGLSGVTRYLSTREEYEHTFDRTAPNQEIYSREMNFVRHNNPIKVEYILDHNEGSLEMYTWVEDEDERKHIDLTKTKQIQLDNKMHFYIDSDTADWKGDSIPELTNQVWVAMNTVTSGSQRKTTF